MILLLRLSARFDVSIDGISDNTSSLSLFLNSAKFTISPPTTIPNSLFTGKYYNITITLCNFIKSCGQKLYTIRIIQSEQLIPTVSILGNIERTIKSSDSLIINSLAYVDNCKAKIYTDLIYNWTVFEFNNKATPQHIKSSAQNPSTLVFPPYSLQPLLVYRINLQVSYILSPEYISSIDVFITVRQVLLLLLLLLRLLQ